MIRADGWLSYSIWEHSTRIRDLYRRRCRLEEVEMTCAAQAAELLESLVSPGDSLLDAGCGSGYLFHSLTKRGLAVEYFGIDAAPSLIEIGRAEMPAFGLPADRLRVLRIEDLDGEVDHVVCMNVLSNVDNYHRLLERLLHCARKSLVLRESCKEEADYRYVRDAYLDEGANLSVYVNAYPQAELMEFVESYGFSVRYVEDRHSGGEPELVIDQPHYWKFFVAEKKMKPSPTPPSYRDYVSDERFMEGYAEYQARYASQIRESDRVLLELVRALVEAPGAPEHPRLLDVGCSTGNLLLHLKHAFPTLELVGADMVGSILDECRCNPDLRGVRFEALDLLELGTEAAFDVVIVNAVLYLLVSEELRRAVASVSRALVPGGSFLAFDFFHPFEQDLTVVEKSETHPDGLVLHLRPYSELEAVLERAGFESVAFRPFAIPIDLPVPSRSADMTSYTQRTDSGERLLFRGALFQPWCHLVARKGGA